MTGPIKTQIISDFDESGGNSRPIFNNGRFYGKITTTAIYFPIVEALHSSVGQKPRNGSRSNTMGYNTGSSSKIRYISEGKIFSLASSSNIALNY